MRTALLALLLIAPPAFGENNFGTFSANGNSDETNLRYGLGNLSISGTWGSGTVALQVRRLDQAWEEVETYTDADAANVTPKVMDFGSPVQVRLVLSGATSPSLYWEIRESGTR